VLGAQEKRLLEAIDGRRNAAEIAVHARLSDHRRARTFFETLWRYDQVVFDASSAS